MTASWCPAPYDLVALVGWRGAAETWRARDRETGAPVLVHRVSTADDAWQERLARTRSAVDALAHPHLCTLRDVATTDGGLALVTDDTSACTLAALVAQRSLTPGEVVTIGAPLADTLAALHGRGVTVGGLTAATVGFAGDGRPLLDIWAAFVDALADETPEQKPAPPDDVAALGGVLATLIPTDAPRSLAAAVSSACDPCAEDRPAAAALAAALLAAVPATPIDFAAPTSSDNQSVGGARARQSGHGRRLSAAGGAAIVVLVAVALVRGVAANAPVRHLAGSSIETASPARVVPTQPERSPRPDWRAVLAGLDARRTAALTRTDAGTLALVDAPGSTQLATDRRLVRTLVARGLHPSGLRVDITAVSAIRVSPGHVVLAVTDRMRRYTLVTATGRSAFTHPARGVRRWRIGLTKLRGRWLIGSVKARLRERPR